jgi:hypothetical protein
MLYSEGNGQKQDFRKEWQSLTPTIPQHHRMNKIEDYGLKIRHAEKARRQQER